MVTTSSLWGRIRSIELELEAVKAEVRELEGQTPQRVPPQEVRSFADLRGIFRGGVQTTEEDLEEAEYRFGWDGNGDD